MFTIKSCIKGIQEPLVDWFITVNGQKCKCNKSIAEKISPIIKEFNESKKNEDSNFETEISDDNTLSDTSNPSTISANSASSLNSICKIISKLFCGEEIIGQSDNYKFLSLIGKHFKIQEIISQIEKYRKYLSMIAVSNLKNSKDFKEMMELEKMLLFEMNETNVETKVIEYESLIKKIPISCFIHFVINICIKNNRITTAVSSNELIIKIIQNVDKIVPETLPLFLSILYNQFIINNSNLFKDNDKYNKKEINSLIHQIFVNGLMKSYKENIKFNQNGVIIPKYLLKYFKKKGNFFEPVKENKTQNNFREKKNHIFSLIEFIENDNVNSFQSHLENFPNDFNIKIKNNITYRISFIGDNDEFSLIELSSFIGSVKCFTYLFNQQPKDKNPLFHRLSNFAIAGGNLEIINICERENCTFNDKTLNISIVYHKHRITKWLVNTKNIVPDEENLRYCIIYYNIKALRYLIKKGINIDQMMIYICESNNTILLKWLEVLLKKYEMKMINQDNNDKSLLHIACERNNVEIFKLLILKNDLDFKSKYNV